MPTFAPTPRHGSTAGGGAHAHLREVPAVPRELAGMAPQSGYYVYAWTAGPSARVAGAEVFISTDEAGRVLKTICRDDGMVIPVVIEPGESWVSVQTKMLAALFD